MSRQFTFKTPFIFTLGFLILFTIGGLTGLFCLMLVLTRFARYVLCSAHFHYVLSMGAVLLFFLGFITDIEKLQVYI